MAGGVGVRVGGRCKLKINLYIIKKKGHQAKRGKNSNK